MPRRLALAEDVEDEYVSASGNAVDPEPSWARAVDALHSQPHRQELRRIAVGAILGSDEEAWSDIIHMGGRRFRRAFAHWLKYV